MLAFGSDGLVAQETLVWFGLVWLDLSGLVWLDLSGLNWSGPVCLARPLYLSGVFVPDGPFPRATDGLQVFASWRHLALPIALSSPASSAVNADRTNEASFEFYVPQRRGIKAVWATIALALWLHDHMKAILQNTGNEPRHPHSWLCVLSLHKVESWRLIPANYAKHFVARSSPPLFNLRLEYLPSLSAAARHIVFWWPIKGSILIDANSRRRSLLWGFVTMLDVRRRRGVEATRSLAPALIFLSD